MKLFPFLVSILISIVGFSQINPFNKTTQLLDKPHGKPVLEINAGVEYWSVKNEPDSLWTKIIVPCFVKQSDVHHSAIADHTVLYNCFEDSIGISLQKINIDTSRHHNCVNLFYSTEYKFADFVGYIETAKIPETYPITELQKDPDSFSDSCFSRIYDAMNSEGINVTVNEDCRMYFEILRIDNDIESVLIKELKTTTSYFTVDTKDVSMKLSIIRNVGTDQQEIHEITSDSYECDFTYKTIILKESKWYAPEYYHMYSTTTYKEIMKYQDQLYRVEIPGSFCSKQTYTAFIGYFINYKNREHGFDGTITLTDGQSVLNQKTILCTNAELADKMYCCTSKMEFIPIHPEDKVIIQDSPILILKSGIGQKDSVSFSGFRVKLYLVGGARGSQHMYGNAADLIVRDVDNDGKVDNRDKQLLLGLLEKIIGNSGGIGRYPGTTSIHIDVRGFRARWDFQN